MMNCTAAQHQGWFAEVYGDYMDGIGSIIFYFYGSKLFSA
jgi:hypothetical protein